MSALGQKQTSAHVRVMSALPPKADIDRVSCRPRGTSLREHALSEATEWPLAKDS
jgi:hypothetical protein